MVCLNVLPDLKFTIRLSLLASLLALLTSCADSEKIKGWFAADPKLTENQEQTNSPQPNPSKTKPAKLPDDFPQAIPRYPEAKLLAATSLENGTIVETRWQSSAPINVISNYYQQQFKNNDWELVNTPASENENPEETVEARRNDLHVKVSAQKATKGSGSEFTIQYKKKSDLAKPPTSQPQKVPIVKPKVTASAKNFSDLNQVPAPIRPYVEDLAKLGVLSITKTEGANQLNPNKAISRRQFARWLFTVNNKLYSETPSKQIRPGSNTEQPAFQDIATTDPDFAIIQGLADAGLIPSRLTGDATTVSFRPGAPLTRQDLLLWKVPLDTRKALPQASVPAVKEAWGFRDAGDIEPKALPAILADHANGDQANIRRMLGYTTLLQPKKPVTNAEAAAALWHFGYQGDGVSAQEALQSQVRSSPSPSPSPSPRE